MSHSESVTRLINRIIIEVGGPNRLGRGETTASKEIRIKPDERDPKVIEAAEHGVCTEADWKKVIIEPLGETALVKLSV